MDNKSKSERKLYYSDVHHSNAYLQEKRSTTGAYKTFSGADRTFCDAHSNAAVPSDSAVEELRDWSVERRQ